MNPVEPFQSDTELIAAIAAVRGTKPLAEVSRHDLRKIFKSINPAMVTKHSRGMTGDEYRQIVYNLLGIWI